MTSRKFFSWAGLLVGLFALQTSLLPRLALRGISPDLLLLVSLSFGFLQGPKYGVLMGFCAGLLQDLATGTFFGVNTLGKMLIGYISGKMSDQVFKEQFFLPVMASLAATAFNYFLLALLLILLGYPLNLPLHIPTTLVPMLCYQLVFAYPVHRLVFILDERLREKK